MRNEFSDAQNKLIEENYRLVWSVVNRFSHLHEEKDDLFQTGCIGLIMAAKKFDASKGFQFSTFAIPYILGEVRNYLRGKTHFKVSKQAFSISKKIKKLIAKNSHLSIKQLAKELNIDYEDVLLGYNLIKESNVLSLDHEIEPNLTVGDVVLKDERYAMGSERVVLGEMVDQLTDIQRQVFYFRYHYGLTQSEIAKKLGVSQSKISRIEKQITDNLSKYYKIS